MPCCTAQKDCQKILVHPLKSSAHLAGGRMGCNASQVSCQSFPQPSSDGTVSGSTCVGGGVDTGNSPSHRTVCNQITWSPRPVRDIGEDCGVLRRFGEDCEGLVRIAEKDSIITNHQQSSTILSSHQQSSPFLSTWMISSTCWMLCGVTAVASRLLRIASGTSYAIALLAFHSHDSQLQLTGKRVVGLEEGKDKLTGLSHTIPCLPALTIASNRGQGPVCSEGLGNIISCVPSPQRVCKMFRKSSRISPLIVSQNMLNAGCIVRVNSSLLIGALHNLLQNSGISALAFCKASSYFWEQGTSSLCGRTARQNVLAKTHVYYKNCDNNMPSTVMEQDFIVEGFRSSEQMHGMRYKHFVEDGNSSVYARLLQNVPYAADKNFVVDARKLLKSSIPHLTAAARGAIRHCGCAGKKVSDLVRDLENGPYHVFGQHERRRSYFCNKEEEEKAKYNAGKRINFTQKDAFQRRCYVAGLQFQKRHSWELSPFKRLPGRSPGQTQKKIMNKKIECQNARKRRRLSYDVADTPAKRCKVSAPPDTDYGPEAEQPEDQLELTRKCKEFVITLQVSVDERDKIANETSVRKDPTSCANLVKRLLYIPNFSIAAMEYGRRCEYIAMKQFERQTGLTVTRYGLFISLHHGFLGASSDGLITQEDQIIEVKCVPSASTVGLKETAKQKKWGTLNITERNVHYVIAMSDRNEPLHIDKVHRDEELWEKEKLCKLERFYINYSLLLTVREAYILVTITFVTCNNFAFVNRYKKVIKRISNVGCIFNSNIWPLYRKLESQSATPRKKGLKKCSLYSEQPIAELADRARKLGEEEAAGASQREPILHVVPRIALVHHNYSLQDLYNGVGLKSPGQEVTKIRRLFFYMEIPILSYCLRRKVHPSVEEARVDSGRPPAGRSISSCDSLYQHDSLASKTSRPLAHRERLGQDWTQLRPAATTAGLEGRLRQMWHDLPQVNIRRLYAFMANHIAVCLYAMGGPTSY
ncbi:hypothetical protein PR048_008587 [Dryococelus australis]|uniref:YqaJ viral recombinase domain-containing protein n=1 Tax=Dryococelus australis TaxID=614101 RepID=A0ABQ9HXI6_9NEOP|nr:hypothetical protein PR048_008587 [Dryococelus australis]